jgi:hypothetical protein
VDALLATDYVELQRTGCFGSCPTYTVRISADGQVSWHGDRWVRVNGPATATVNPADARALLERLRTNGFWELCDTYSTRVTDGATVSTTLHVGNHEKRVSDYLSKAPDSLRMFEREIDSLAGTHRWINGDPRMEVVAVVRTTEARIDPSLGLIRPTLGSAEGPKPGLTPLMKASARGDIDEIRRQLSLQADPNAQDSSGWTPLFYATQAKELDAIKILLDAGANPNVRSHMDQTAVMGVVSAYYFPAEKLQLLIPARVDINAQDVDGHTALMFAMYGSLIYNPTDKGFLDRVALVTLMREAGARPELRDATGLTALDYLEREAKIYPQQKAQYDKLRQILQN